MANYYFLAASLPPLVLGEKPDLSFEELSARLSINLTVKDFEKIIKGDYDYLPEQAFYMVGTLEEAREKARSLGFKG